MKNEIEKKSKIVDYKPFGVAAKYVADKLIIASEPIEMIHNDTVYRIVPMYKDVAVSATGMVISLKYMHILKQRIVGHGYLGIVTTDYLNKKVILVLAHRLVALAWITNVDYVKKNIIDHKDRNKKNNTVGNLRWVTPSENVSLHNHNQLGRFTVTDMLSGNSVSKNSLREIAIYLNTSYKNLTISRLPQIIKKDGIDHFIYDNTDNHDVDVTTMYLNTKHAFKTVKIKDVTKINYFLTKESVIESFRLDCNHKYTTVNELKRILLELGYRLIVINTATTDKYDIKNINSGVTHEKLSVEDVAKIITGVSKSALNTRFNKRYRYGVPINGWIIKFSSDTEYMSGTITNDKIWYLTKANGTIITFESLRAIARHLNVDRKTVKNYAGTNKQFQNQFITTA